MEAYLRAGADLVTAVARVDESLGVLPSERPPEPATERVPSAAENDRALAELQKLMGGLA